MPINRLWKSSDYTTLFDIYLVASGASEKSAKQKACILLHVVGDEAMEVYNNFKFAKPEDAFDFAEIMQKFQDHCTPQKSTTYERHKFFTFMQKDETIDQYVTELRLKHSLVSSDSLRPK